MLRTVALVTLAATLLPQGLAARGGSPGARTAAVTYELQINGESFLVEANRDTTLESKKKPGVTLQCGPSGIPHATGAIEFLAFRL